MWLVAGLSGFLVVGSILSIVSARFWYAFWPVAVIAIVVSTYALLPDRLRRSRAAATVALTAMLLGLLPMAIIAAGSWTDAWPWLALVVGLNVLIFLLPQRPE